MRERGPEGGYYTPTVYQRSLTKMKDMVTTDSVSRETRSAHPMRLTRYQIFIVTEETLFPPAAGFLGIKGSASSLDHLATRNVAMLSYSSMRVISRKFRTRQLLEGFASIYVELRTDPYNLDRQDIGHIQSRMTQSLVCSYVIPWPSSRGNTMASEFCQSVHSSIIYGHKSISPMPLQISRKIENPRFMPYLIRRSVDFRSCHNILLAKARPFLCLPIGKEPSALHFRIERQLPFLRLWVCFKYHEYDVLHGLSGVSARRTLNKVSV